MKRISWIFNLFVILTMVFPWNQASAAVQPQSFALSYDPAASAGIFRTTITIENTYNRNRLDELGVKIASESENSAVVVVSESQLEKLARLGYEPTETEDLGMLVDAHTADQPVESGSLQSVIDQAQPLAAGLGIQTTGDEQETTALNNLVSQMTAEQAASAAALSAIDDDDDGLTNTQENWWCTNPIDDDSDDDGIKDGVEIQTAKDWMANKLPGPAFDTPWASWPFNDTTCPDKDHDSIPNLAERWELGLNMDLESTDHDRYDDGQELFGVTYCPGSGSACGYGTLPSANYDGVLLFPQMPSWVTPPGNHPLITAFPKLDINIVPDSDGKEFRMVTTTVITTDKRIEKGETKSYSTTKTEGTSTSNSESETWETWQEVSNTTKATNLNSVNSLDPTFRSSLASSAITEISINNSVSQVVQSTNISTTSVVQNYTNTKKENGILSGAKNLIAKNADFILDQACKEANINCMQYVAAGIRTAVHAASQIPDIYQKNIKSNECAKDLWGKLSCAAKALGTTISTTFQDRLNDPTLLDQEDRGQVSGSQLSSNGDGVDIRDVYPLTYPLSNFIPTTTNTTGSSTGGSRTTTHTQYEEYAVTEGTAHQITTSEGTATAEDTSHAADLWFAYEIKNIGTDYAREICNISFNIYIGNDSIPAATYFPGNDLGTGCFLNFRPGESHKYSFPSNKRIELTLDQVKAIDSGQPVRIVVEDFSLGQDDFYTDDAIKAGITISIDDGLDDGDDLLDTYVLATSENESVLSTLGRYFPFSTDSAGMMISIFTPEYRSDTPEWCQNAKRIGTTLWCEHALSTSDWWYMYLNGLGDGNEGFQELIGAPNTQAIFRFNKDTDNDGYSDRSETILKTDPNDPSSLPSPEIIGGLFQSRSGNNVVSTLSLLNTGLYDAYGIEAVMVAPDDSITITNNTVGGSGRVKAGKDVVVGSRILAPVYTSTSWTGTTKPVSGGYFTGTADLTYSFTVSCAITSGCILGQDAWSLVWNDGTNSGNMSVESGYQSPTMLSVGNFGLKISLLSGKVYNGNTFTIEARTPRDTFQYTINREPYSQPIVIVSYNDPQGNHRFMLPSEAMLLADPTIDLMAFSGKMRDLRGVEIVTEQPFAVGANTTSLVVDNPAEVTLQNSRLFLEFIDEQGNVAAEVSATQNLPSGPSVVEMPWDTAGFNPAYDSAQEYIVMAFWTDYEGNILDASGRPLSSFQADPQAKFAMAETDQTWDFGTASQGSVLKRTFTFANTGERELLTYVDAPNGLSVSQVGSAEVGAADQVSYEITLNTSGLQVGAFNQTITIHTSDPANAVRTVQVTGMVTTGSVDIPTGQLERPLDYSVTVPGPQTQGSWYSFTQPIGPDPQSIHPVKVYSQDYSKLWGVGKYATDFGGGSVMSYATFGDGADGSLLVPAGTTKIHDVPSAFMISNTSAGSISLTVNDATSFNIGDEIMIIQSQGDTTGKYEFGIVTAKSSQTLILSKPIVNSYQSLNAPCGGNYLAQYYNNTSLSGTPVLVRCEASVSMDVEGGSPAPQVQSDNFSVRWSAPRYISQEADYSIGVWVDDGIRIYMDGILVLNQWPANGWYSSNVHITSGWHSFVVEYYEAGGQARGAAGIPGALWHTQVIKVPHYTNVTIETGGILKPSSWNGLVGGVLAFRTTGNITVNGSILGTGYGYRGGDESPTTTGTYAAEGTLGFYNNIFRDCWSNRNANGNGGGSGHCWIPDGWGVERYASGGGGGSNETEGGGGGCHTGTDRCWCAGGAGYVTEDNNFTFLYMGGGGGSGGASKDSSNNGQAGGDGGGILYLTGRQIAINGSIASNGTKGNNVIGYDQWTAGGGGGGAGGSIFITGSTINIQGSLEAIGGAGGTSIGQGAGGGNGGNGRVRIDYCDSLTGTSNPSPVTVKRDCYIVEQTELSPFNQSRLSLPEAFTIDRSYNIQYGVRSLLNGTVSTSSFLRLPAGLLSITSLDTMISGVGSGSLTYSLDIGNDGTTDWTWIGNVTNSIALTNPSLAQAFNRWWAANGRPTSGDMDVPVRVSLSKAGQVLLTNLQVESAGSTLRNVRLEAGTYSQLALDYALTGAITPITVGVDLGDDGTIDDTYTIESPANPQPVTSGNLADAASIYLTGQSGEVDIPIRFYLPEGVSLHLDTFEANRSGNRDASVSAGDIVLPADAPTEGAVIPLSATLHNLGDLPSGGVVAAFFANSADWGEWYLGSAFVPDIPAGGSALAQIQWNTLGFTGDVPVRVEIDPYNRLVEADETNNSASTTYTIRTRPDLSVADPVLSDDEPLQNETIKIRLPIQNSGQTDAGAFTTRLYDGNPAEGGVLIGEQDLAVGAGAQQEALIDWTPTQAGAHRLFAVTDSGNVVNESSEGNNSYWMDMYVGFASPIILDSGNSAQDPLYSIHSGYGVIDNGSPDVSTTCGSGTEWENTLRRDPNGQLVYQFDHLQPSHFYHLDLVLYECDSAGRQETVTVDGMTLAGPVDLGNGQVHRLSLRLDPALYSDHRIQIAITAPGADGAVVAAVNLHDIDYRYADAGGTNDPQYPGSNGFGWLDGGAITSYGSLPYQSVRVDQYDNHVRYQFDNLQAGKEYDLQFSFWQPSGTGRIQKVKVDGMDLGLSIDTGDYQIHRMQAQVSAGLYASDGSIVVTIERTNATTGAIVNEIALEERTIMTGEPLNCNHVKPTPYFTDSYGMLTYFGLPAEVGQRVEALNPRGEVVGCYIVDTAGQYGLMHIYGEDKSTNPPTPGMRAGEKVTYRVSGFPAYATPELTFQDDHASHNVDLEVRNLTEQTMLLNSGWNLIGFNVESPAPLVPFMIAPIQSRVDRLVGETGVYTPTLADTFVTLKELHAQAGYYVLVNGSTSVNWVVTGQSVPDGTPIALHAGWNWIGGPQVSRTVETALASIAGSYRRVINLTKAYDTSLPASFNSLKNLIPGEGYLIYVTQAVNLTYPVDVSSPQASMDMDNLDVDACSSAQPTPNLTLIYGNISINGLPAPTGTKVEAVTPRGEVAGCGVIEEPGILPLMHVYGTEGEIGGFAEGEPIQLRVNGLMAKADSVLTWTNDKDTHPVTLNTNWLKLFLPLIDR